MSHIDLVVRQKIGKMVEKCMADYEGEIEDAYSQKEGEFAIAFKAKMAPKGDALKVKVEMAFDPHQKIKDSVEETIDKKQKPLFGEDTTDAVEHGQPDG